MNNHIHLLLQEVDNNLSKIMQSIGTSYAIYFNKKYERIGHVFHNRFKSKKIEEISYLLNVLRYIHFNPEKAGLGNFSDYRWSSYYEYTTKSNLICKEELLKLINKSMDEFYKIHEEPSKVLYGENMELSYKNKINDEQAIKEIKQILNIDNMISIQNYNTQKRDGMIEKASQIKGIERKQLARILGISERAVYRAIKNVREKYKVCPKTDNSVSPKERPLTDKGGKM